jgi:hypothetical protein
MPLVDNHFSVEISLLNINAQHFLEQDSILTLDLSCPVLLEFLRLHLFLQVLVLFGCLVVNLATHPLKRPQVFVMLVALHTLCDQAIAR